MKLKYTLVAWTCALTSVSADPQPVPGVVSVPVVQKLRIGAHVNKRANDDGVAGTIKNRQNAYYAQFEVGTPGQKVQAILDTGSSDVWVYGKPSGIKDSYDANKSSTYQYVNSDFEIFYAQGTGAHGDYVKDTLKYGGFTVKNQQFAVVNKPTQPEDGGIFGIGMVEDESVKTRDELYPNLPQNLKDQGIISRNIYSLFLNDLDASTGSVLFGGIDSEKYTGELETVPVVQGATGFDVPLSYNGKQFSALLDSGTTFMMLQGDMVKDIAQKTGATFDSKGGLYVLDNTPSEGISFKLGNKEIQIPGSEIVVEPEDVGYNTSKKFVLPILPVDPMSGSGNILGQSFLRSAYVVFDADKKQIQIAQASYSNKSNIYAVVD